MLTFQLQKGNKLGWVSILLLKPVLGRKPQKYSFSSYTATKTRPKRDTTLLTRQLTTPILGS